MRKFENRFLLLPLVIVFLLIACKDNDKTASSEKTADIPITSKSKEAIAAFREGLAFADENNGNKARTAFTKAIQLDSTLAIAYMYRSDYDLSVQEGMNDLAHAKAHL